MGRRIREIDVATVLADAGHLPSQYDPATGWDPGYRTAQAGPRMVHVYHDGPGEADALETYRRELQTAGYCVVPDQMPHGGGRRRLHITQP
jgi:hypothetical protein